MQKLEDNDGRENTQVGWDYGRKWVLASIVAFSLIGPVGGYILFDRTWRSFAAIFISAGGAVVGLILGVITGAIRNWMLQRQKRPPAFKEVGVSVVYFTVIGIVVGFILPIRTELREFHAIVGGFVAAVVGYIYGATKGAKEVWMLQRRKRPLAE